MCIVIAEAGENHCGDMDAAVRLIQLARDAGCDYVKFQYYKADRVSPDDPEYDWFQRVQLNEEKLRTLIQESAGAGIQFLCTAWDRGLAERLASLGVKDLKIASFLITDLDLLEYANAHFQRVFLSTGMSSLEEIDRAVSLLKETDLFLLHCVSEYPLTADKVNLRVMDFLRDKFGCAVGYSDHTIGILAPISAAARGADVIEKHITLDHAAEGTDHILSADPGELKLMVEQIRMIERMLGDGVKKITASEMDNQEFFRKRFSH